jgi:polar amino acid transport system substrate-binding protein
MTNKNRIIPGLALLLAACIGGTAFAGATFDKVRGSGHLRLGYLPQAKPFTSVGADGKVEGYGAALCGEIARRVQAELAMPQLAVDWVPVTMDTGFTLVMRGDVDVLCTPTVATLGRRKALAYSLPTFAGGVRAVVRSDAPSTLKDVLEATPAQRNVWRGSPAMSLIKEVRFAAVAGTTSERWLATKVQTFKINAATTSVPDYASGLRFLQEGKYDVFFAERDVVLANLDEASKSKVIILNRQLTHEPLALGLPRGDEDFRLFVDTVLSNTYNAADFPALYVKYFGAFDEPSRLFFSWVTPPP